MKVVRLKKGYRINLSDSEFDVLCQIFTDGEMVWEGDPDMEFAGYTPAMKRAYTMRNQRGHFLGLDEDRRSPLTTLQRLGQDFDTGDPNA